jgi:diguanylate cyclase (GGDEF)-like protein/PAS domain S-box-containing protein
LVVVISCAIGLLFATATAVFAHRHETNRLHAQVEQLASTVENTVSVACYVGDKALAHEVALGLLKNHAVAAVKISSLTDVLDSTARERASPESSRPVIRKMISPFDSHEIVGELVLIPARDEIRSQAFAISGFSALVLFLQTAALAAVVAMVVLRSIVRPITDMSDELHRMQIETGQHLRIPLGDEQNEIGRLARDTNSLISRFVKLLASERHQRHERELSELQLRSIFDNAECGIFVIDLSGQLISWNPASARELGFSPVRPANAEPLKLDALLAPHSARVRLLLARCRESKSAMSEDLEVKRDGAGSKWLNVFLQPIDENRFQGMAQDITNRKRVEAEALALAERDSLTGLLNRRGMEQVLKKILSENMAGRAGTVTLMLMDLDWFKEVNDKHGHEAGDHVLRTIALRVQSSVRPSDMVARLGGDEFVLATTLDDVPAINTLISRIIERVAEPIALANGERARVGASIGVATFDPKRMNVRSLLSAADAAMYDAKQSGRSRYAWASVTNTQRFSEPNQVA